MKQKKGFIAVSMIYSFFLVFLMIILATTAKNAQTRQMLRVFKDDIKAELNQKEFIVIKIPQDDYQINQEIDFVGDIWQVIANKSDSVVLMLKRALNMQEITEALEVSTDDTGYFNNSCNATSCRVKMCSSKFSMKYCYYYNSTSFNQYRWENSIVKYILNRWLEQNVNLQKICRWQYDEVLQKRVCQKDTLMEMTFSDGLAEQKEYIRIATLSEIASNPIWKNNNPNAWTLTREKELNGKSYVYSFSTSLVTSENAQEIHPVIEVRKS